MPELVKQGIGVLGMKPMANGILLKSKTVTPIECLHYALHLPTSVVITGIDSMRILDQALEAVRTFRPLTDQQLNSLLAKTAQAAAQGEFEPFKTTSVFDGTRSARVAGPGASAGSRTDAGVVKSISHQCTGRRAVAARAWPR